MDTIKIGYRFTLEDGSREDFDITLDARKIELVGVTPETLPPWTRLDFHQCPNCPLTVDTHPRCPLAVSLVPIVERFDRIMSYDKIHVDVITEERMISQDTTAQTGISSMMGLVIAASGCPHTVFFRPMARFHLPLAGDEETIYRVTSMHLLAQYFRKKAGKRADLEFETLTELYRNIHVVNTAVAGRLRAASKTDSTVNAIVDLDMYTIYVPYLIEESLGQIRHLFSPYLEGAAPTESGRFAGGKEKGAAE